MANPDVNFNSQSFGMVNAIAANARIGQLALKFAF